MGKINQNLGKGDQNQQYNSSLYKLIPGHIAYDKKVYKAVGPYIQDHLWKHMDESWIEKAVFVLDDPLQKYENDTETIKQVLMSFLPTVKKLLNLDTKHHLKDHIDTALRNKGLLDRLIQQQLNLYSARKNTTGSLTQILQQEQKNDVIDTKQSTKKTLIVDKVPQTQKNIIANILTFMILEEETQKEETQKR